LPSLQPVRVLQGIIKQRKLEEATGAVVAEELSTVATETLTASDLLAADIAAGMVVDFFF
jgi:hypothetical protein